jgi:hypothetical protein
MKTVHIICSIKNLNYDYEYLQWLRVFFLSNNYHLSEDWINHSLTIKNNKPYFKAAPNFDYMKVATDSVNDCDLVVLLMSEPSTFTLTMLRYSLYVGKSTVVIVKNRSVLKGLGEDKTQPLTVLSTVNYQKKLREII